MPSAWAATSPSRIATKARPDRRLHRVLGDHVEHECGRPAQVVDADLLRDRKRREVDGRRDEAARPERDRGPVAHQPERELGEREGREGEVDAGQAKGGEGEQGPRDDRDGHPSRSGDPERKAEVLHEKPGSVRADAVHRGVREGELAREPDEEVQPERQDDVEQDEVRDEGVVLVRDPGDHEEEDEEDGEERPLPDEEPHRGVGAGPSDLADPAEPEEAGRDEDHHDHDDDERRHLLHRGMEVAGRELLDDADEEAPDHRPPECS